jgi:hypothetical protein
MISVGVSGRGQIIFKEEENVDSACENKGAYTIEARLKYSPSKEIRGFLLAQE